MKSDKNWQIFLIALGFFLVATSPFTPIKILNIITGLVLVLLGYYLVKKEK